VLTFSTFREYGFKSYGARFRYVVHAAEFAGHGDAIPSLVSELLDCATLGLTCSEGRRKMKGKKTKKAVKRLKKAKKLEKTETLIIRRVR
jgi:hypothetical protein